jgi:hypothetical protein
MSAKGEGPRLRGSTSANGAGGRPAGLMCELQLLGGRSHSRNPALSRLMR